MPNRDIHEFFDCDCNDPSHLLRVDLYEWDTKHPDDIQLCISTQLNQYLPFWKRISMAFKYALGKSAGEWYTTTLVKTEDVDRLKNIIRDFEDRRTRLKHDIDEKGN
jgi:hypothetical protein